MEYNIQIYVMLGDNQPKEGLLCYHSLEWLFVSLERAGLPPSIQHVAMPFFYRY